MYTLPFKEFANFSKPNSGNSEFVFVFSINIVIVTIFTSYCLLLVAELASFVVCPVLLHSHSSISVLESFCLSLIDLRLKDPYAECVCCVLRRGIGLPRGPSLPRLSSTGIDGGVASAS